MSSEGEEKDQILKEDNTVSEDKPIENESDSSIVNKSIEIETESPTTVANKLNEAISLMEVNNLRINNKENNNTSNATNPATSISEPICNGHASQFCNSNLDPEFVDKGGEGEKISASAKENGASLENPVVHTSESMSVGAGESLVENSEIAESLGPGIVNSVSMDSYDLEEEDMQTEGNGQDGKIFKCHNF